MEYRSIKKPPTFGSVTLANAKIAAKSMRPLRRTASSFDERCSALVERKLAPLEATKEEIKRSRFSPRLIRSLRKHLDITQKELAILSGVTVGAIQQWESGMFKPKVEKKGVIVALRKLGRPEVRSILEEKAIRVVEKGARTHRSKKEARISSFSGIEKRKR